MLTEIPFFFPVFLPILIPMYGAFSDVGHLGNNCILLIYHLFRYPAVLVSKGDPGLGAKSSKMMILEH